MYNLDNNPVIDGDEIINSERTNGINDGSPALQGQQNDQTPRTVDEQYSKCDVQQMDSAQKAINIEDIKIQALDEFGLPKITAEEIDTH